MMATIPATYATTRAPTEFSTSATVVNAGVLVSGVMASWVRENERWFWEDPSAIASFDRSCDQLARGERIYLGDFSKFAD